MHKTTKRGFLKAALASGLALEAFPARSDSQKSSEQLITIIDLDKCDGCSVFRFLHASKPAVLKIRLAIQSRRSRCSLTGLSPSMRTFQTIGITFLG